MADFTEVWNPNQGDLGDLMTMDEFLEAVENGLFVDDDGFGNPAVQFEDGIIRTDVDIEILPSEFKEQFSELDCAGATHVVWFNK